MAVELPPGSKLINRVHCRFTQIACTELGQIIIACPHEPPKMLMGDRFVTIEVERHDRN